MGSEEPTNLIDITNSIVTARYVSWLASGPHVDLWGRYNAKRLIGISSNRTDLGAVRLIPLKLLSHYGRENLSQASSEIQNFNLLSSHLQLTNVCVPSIDVSIRKLTKLSTTDEVEISRMLKEELWVIFRQNLILVVHLFVSDCPEVPRRRCNPYIFEHGILKLAVGRCQSNKLWSKRTLLVLELNNVLRIKLLFLRHLIFIWEEWFKCKFFGNISKVT